MTSKTKFSAEDLSYGDMVRDLSGQPAKFLAYKAGDWLTAVLQLNDGVVVTRNVRYITELVEDEIVTLRITLSQPELEAMANYPLGSVCNPAVMAARRMLQEQKNG